MRVAGNIATIRPVAGSAERRTFRDVQCACPNVDKWARSNLLGLVRLYAEPGPVAQQLAEGERLDPRLVAGATRARARRGTPPC